MEDLRAVEVVWPLVGRAAELERVAGFLRVGQGAIVLAGPAGVGKTRLGSECLEVAAFQGFVPLRVAATQGAAGLPFGAFAHLTFLFAPSSGDCVTTPVTEITVLGQFALRT